MRRNWKSLPSNPSYLRGWHKQPPRHGRRPRVDTLHLIEPQADRQLRFVSGREEPKRRESSNTDPQWAGRNLLEGQRPCSALGSGDAGQFGSIVSNPVVSRRSLELHMAVRFKVLLKRPRTGPQVSRSDVEDMTCCGRGPTVSFYGDVSHVCILAVSY